MTEVKDLKPYINIGVGDILKRNLRSLGWTQEDLSQITDVSRKTLSSITNNKQKLSIDIAKKLGDAFDTSAEYWLNLDNNYWLNQDDGEDPLTTTERKARIRKYIPILELVKKGWIDIENTADEYENVFKKTWNVNDIDISVYDREAKYCARRSKEDAQFTKYYSITWYQFAKNNSKKIVVPKFNKNKLNEIAKHFTNYTIHNNGVSKVLNDLNSAGVKFFVQSHLSKTYLDGACFYSQNNPVIVYTARYNRVDNFWFTLAHEIAHVLLHLDKVSSSFYLDDLDKKNTSKVEEEADQKAEEILNVREILKKAEPYKKYFSEDNLHRIADEIGIEISLLLGILQYNGYIDYRKLNRYKHSVKEYIPIKTIIG